MKNDWLKEKVKEELEVEYKQKLDEVVSLYEKRLLAERARNDQLEVKLYEEYEKKLTEYRQFIMG